MNDIFKIAVNTGTVTPSKPKAVAEQRKSEKADKPEERRNHYRRQRAILNFIPEPEQLENLIQRALQALSRGIYWDRGSIINIIL